MQWNDWLKLLLWLVPVLWVLINANLRKNNVVGWTVLAFLTGPFVIPFYLAHRNLRHEEVRKGGRFWNVLRNFAVLWAVLMGYWFFVTPIRITHTSHYVWDEHIGLINASSSVIEMAVIFGLCVWAAIWIIAIVSKRKDAIEKGPTGRLKETEL